MILKALRVLTRGAFLQADVGIRPYGFYPT